MSPLVSPRSVGPTIPALLSFLTLSLVSPAAGHAQQPKVAARAAAKATPTEAALDRLAKQPAVAKALAALQIENDPPYVQLTWPSVSPDWSLETSDNLSSWLPFPTEPTLSINGAAQALTPSGARRFFRLHKP